jgi:ATP-dependent RNA helicase SUPV3L1/SUV3
MSLAAELHGSEYDALVELRHKLGLDAEVREPQFVKYRDAAALLKVDLDLLKKLIDLGHILTARSHGNRGREFVLLGNLAHALDTEPAWLREARRPIKNLRSTERKTKSQKRAELKDKRTARNELRSKSESLRKQALPSFSGAIRVVIPRRQREPLSIIAHLGPTNSGKTHEAINFLCQSGQGVYAAPLRMLAQEAYERLKASLGEEKVGLITGEEQINPHAPVIACTTEMAPSHGETLVLDEVHWACDKDRGSAWTQLLAGGNYKHIRLVGALDALPLIRQAFPQVELRIHERLLPLTFEEDILLDDLKPRTVLIGFSRRVVLGLAQAVAQKTGKRPAVLYGAMPPAARRKEIARFISGEASVCVATDVLGHGINLPCDEIVFAETSKWDGSERRDLEAWEIAQIAGRAGRFGLSERGVVRVLYGQAYLTPSASLVEASLSPRVELEEGIYGYRRVECGRLAPRLGDLGVKHPGQFHGALLAWEKEAKKEFEDEGWLHVESMSQRLERLDGIKRAFAFKDQPLSKVRVPLSVEEVWSLINAPADEADADLLGLLARLLAGVAKSGALEWLFNKSTLHKATLHEAESIARAARLLRWFSLRYYGVGGITPERASQLEESAAAKVTSALVGEISTTSIGFCEECGVETAPWFSRCDSCHFAAK